MKVFLVLIFCWIMGESQGQFPNLPEEAKDYNKICIAECNASNDLQNRILRLKFKPSDEDLCYLKCAGRILRILENHKYNLEVVRALFGWYKIVILDDFKDLKDIKDTDPDFVEKVAKWLDKNKQANLDLDSYVRRKKNKS